LVETLVLNKWDFFRHCDRDVIEALSKNVTSSNPHLHERDEYGEEVDFIFTAIFQPNCVQQIICVQLFSCVSVFHITKNELVNEHTALLFCRVFLGGRRYALASVMPVY
jgi:hypothetical protein